MVKALLIMLIVGNITTAGIYFGTESWTLTIMYAILLAGIRFRRRLRKVFEGDTVWMGRTEFEDSGTSRKSQ